MSNAVLERQKREKNDEYYTQYEDIKEEVLLYSTAFKDSVVYCPCDDPSWSNFYKFFCDYFDVLKLKRLVCTWLGGYRLEFDGKQVFMVFPGNDGDFRKNEIPKSENTIICTNPPFSLFRAFRDWCGDNKILVIGNKNALFYQNVWNSGWVYGFHKPTHFSKNGAPPEKYSGLFIWYTNLTPDVPFVRKKPVLVSLNSEIHKHVENYINTINTDSTRKIPDVPDAIVAVPIDVMQLDLSDFEVLGFTKKFALGAMRNLREANVGRGRADVFIDGRMKYTRVFLKRKLKCST